MIRRVAAGAAVLLALAGLAAWWWHAGAPDRLGGGAPAATDGGAVIGAGADASGASGANGSSGAVDAGLPPLADEQALLTGRQGGDWRVYRWGEHPEVLVIEFPSLWAQGATLNRMAAMLEKGASRRDRVLDDGALASLIAASGDNAASFYLGHDYDAPGLARFFNAARAQGVSLNADEARLLRLLLAQRLIVEGTPMPEASGPYQPGGNAALVTFSAEQPDDPATPQDERMDARRRASILSHELSHGAFFTQAAYREHCWAFWRELLSEAERARWRRMLAGMGYDTRDETLMVNEMQALLMHTPDERDFNASSLGLRAAELEGLRARFRLGTTAAAASR